MLAYLSPAFLTAPQLSDELRARPGLIPISFDGSPDGRDLSRIVWLDLDGYHCYEGFFSQSLASYRAMLAAPAARFITDTDSLGSAPLNDCLQPAGFIFHVGRCGSTLLAKVLARSRENLVFSEAAPHNQVWKILPEDRNSAIDFYRRLVLAMGRRRISSYRRHFIKFTSYNILRFSWIRAAFPDTPAIFLFRHPDAVIASSAREAQPWLGMDIGFGRIWTDAEAALVDCSRAALNIRDCLFRCMDYAALTPESLTCMLRFFGSDPSSPQELALMKSEFSWDAKSGRTPRRFEPRPQETGLAGPDALAVYGELVARFRADWPEWR